MVHFLFKKIKRISLLIFTISLLFVFYNNDVFANICDGGAQCTGTDKSMCEAVSGCSWIVNKNLQNETALVGSICNAVQIVTGTGGKIFAALAIVSIGIGFYLGKVSWGLVVGVGGGIATIFGSFTIVAAISGGTVFGCEISQKDDCNSSSPGYEIPDNATGSATTALHNWSIAISCNDGYIGDVNKLVCFDGEWFGGSGTCIESSCQDPSDSNPLTNGTWDEVQAIDGATISGTCEDGYMGSPTIKCIQNSYTDQQGSCEELPTCDQTSQGYKIIFGSWTPATVYVGESASPVCDDPLGTPPENMRCDFNPNDSSKAIWKGGDNEDCKVFQKCINASGFQNLLNGSWSDQTANHNQSVTGGCLNGIDGSTPTLSCTDGVWTSNGANCPYGCTSASTFEMITDGNWQKENANHNETISAICLNGANIIPQLTCENGIWTSNNGNCLLGCSNANAFKAMTNGSWSKNNALHGETITANCTDNNATVIPELSCDDGIWSHNGAMCPAGCSNANSFKTLSSNGSWSSQTASHGNIIEGTCPDGIGTTIPQLTCNNGAWQSNSYDCPAGCTNANSVANLSINYGNWPSQNTKHNSFMVGNCPHGYDAQQPRITCNSGVWNWNNFHCAHVVICDKNSPGYKLIHGTWSNNSTVTAGNSITPKCTLSGPTPTNLLCTDDNGSGVWTGGNGDCTPVTCPRYPAGCSGWGCYPATVAPKGGTGWRCAKRSVAAARCAPGYPVNACNANGAWWSGDYQNCIDARSFCQW